MKTKNRFLAGASNFRIIADRLVKNDSLVALMTRNVSSVLADKTKVSNSERAAMMKQIQTVPVLPKEEGVGSYIIVSMGSITPMGTGLSYNITFDILCNTDIWNLDGDIPRPYLIMNEIDEMFNDTKMNGIGPTTFIGAAPIKINEKMLGYTMLFNVGEI